MREDEGVVFVVVVVVEVEVMERAMRSAPRAHAAITSACASPLRTCPLAAPIVNDLIG